MKQVRLKAPYQSTLAVGVMLALVFTLSIASPVAAKCGTVTGQANDADGNGWTHGGTVTIRRNTDNVIVGTSTLTGTGSYSVGVAPPENVLLDITIVFNPGPNGTPANATDSIQDTGGGTVTCNAGTVSTNTGPNAVDLSRLAAARGAAGWQMAAIALLGLLGLGAGLWWARGRRQALAG